MVLNIPIVIVIGLLGTVCVAALGTAIYLWPQRTRPGGREFLVMLIAIFVWTSADALELIAATLENKVFWRLAQQVGIVLLPPSWLLFTFAYLDFQPWSRSRARWLLYLVPAITLIIAFTNDSHHLFFHHARLSSDIPPQLEIVPNRWFWIHVGYSYLCLTTGLALLIGAFWHASPLFRSQTVLIGLGLIFPFLLNWAYLSQVTQLGFDPTPISFLLSAPFIIRGVYRYQFLHLVPIARDRLIEALADAMLVIDQHERIIDLNPAAQRLFGALVHINARLPDTLKWPALVKAAQSSEPVRIELNCPEYPDRFFDITIDPFYDQNGLLNGRILIFREITERKRIEQQLQEALRRFTDMIEQTPLVAIQRIDRHGIVLEWNRVCEQFYGYTAAEACGRRLQDLILSGPDVVEFEQQIEQIWTTGQPLPPRTWQIHTKTGEVRWFYSAMVPLFLQGQVSEIVCMDVDITEIRHAEANLRRQRDQLAALHRLTLDWLNRREMDDLLQAITDSAYQVLNVSYTELQLAKDGHTLVMRACTPPLPHIKQREIPTNAPLSWRAFRTGQPAIVLNYTTWSERDPDYEQFGFGPAMALPIIAGDECLGVIGMARDQHGAPFTPDEIQHAMLIAQLAALVLDNAKLYAAAQHEIAERKLAEQQQAKLQAQLLQAQKLEAIGQLAGGIAHDFNNILTVITGNVELALLEVAPDHPVYPELESIRQSTSRASELVRQLLTFARRKPGQPQLININCRINDTMSMMKRLIGEDIRLRLELTEPIDQVMIDPHQFEQVLINLVVNARDAMPNGGELTIRTNTHYFATDEIPALSRSSAGKYVLLSVSDTGTGIDESILTHIFEPYFTTKPMGKGSGLGLAVCNGIVTQHGGFILVDSQINSGSCFTVALPAVTTATTSPPAQMSAASELCTIGHETILLVEDEPQVRQLATRLLREHGYTVLEASQVEEALRIAQTYSKPIHLVLTDVVLPQSDGIALANRLRTFLPHLRIILMSGYVQHMVADRNDGLYPVLSKPFTRQQLLTMIRQTIDQTS